MRRDDKTLRTHVGDFLSAYLETNSAMFPKTHSVDYLRIRNFAMNKASMVWDLNRKN